MRGKRKVKGEENTLLTALKFISAAQRAIGATEQTHSRLFNNWIVASNGIISAAHAIQEDIRVCPHTTTLIHALEECTSSPALTLLDEFHLSVQCGEFQAIVPCIEQGKLPAIYADAPQFLCGADFFNAMEIAGSIVSDTSDKVVNSCVQIRNGSCIASNGNVIIEAWHGFTAPGYAIVPKAMCTALKKWQGKAVYRLGASDSSVTVWYEDGNWLKSQIYPANTPLPALDKFLEAPVTPVPVPENLFVAAKRLDKFSEDGRITFTDNGAKVTMPSQMTYAIDKLENVPAGLSFNIKSLSQIAPYAKTIHFEAMPGVTLWFGDKVRGAIATHKGE